MTQQRKYMGVVTHSQTKSPPDKWDVFKGFYSVIHKSLPKISLKLSNFVRIFCKCARYFLGTGKNGPLFRAHRAGWFPGAPGSKEGPQSALATHFAPAALHRTKSWNCLVKIVLKSIFTCIFHGSKVTLLRKKNSNWHNMSWRNKENIWVLLPIPKQNHPPTNGMFLRDSTV